MTGGISRSRVFAVLALATATLPATAQEAALGKRMDRQPGYLLEQHLDSSRLAILPLGSIEYHGPSGPMQTDSIIAEGLAGRLADQLGASLLPVLNYTHAPAHSAAFRGTLSVRGEVVTMLLTDVLTGLAEAGFKKVLLLNGHDGNIGPARAAMSRVTHLHPEAQMVLISWWETLPTPEVEALGLFTSGNGGHGHGGPLELSVAAVFAPESVEPGKGPDLPALSGMASFPYYLEKADVTGWPGYSGKLSEISGEKGETLVGVAVGKILDFARRWLADDKAPGSW